MRSSSFVGFLFVYEIPREPLNGFAPISEERRVWSLARASLNVKSKVRGQGHQGQKRAAYSHHPRQRRNGPFCCMTHCNALAANNFMQQQTGPSRRCRAVILAACVRFKFRKTSLAVVTFVFGRPIVKRFALCYRTVVLSCPVCPVDLGAGHIVLDGFPALRERGTARPPLF